MNFTETLTRLTGGSSLSEREAGQVMQEIIEGTVSPAQAGALLTALRMKGESPEEIAAYARVMREHGVRSRPRCTGTLVDTCGTGGDGSGTFNISTTAAFVTAGAGVPVVKHGNRGMSSRCGSADVFEALGIRIDLPPSRMEKVIEDVGIGILFAQLYHPGVKHVAGVRRELGIRTVFNLLGPLANPAGAQAQLMGVYSPVLTGPLAEVHRLLGTRRALVVHGSGLDEITTTGPTTVAELNDGGIATYTLSPGDFGLPQADLSSLAGGTPQENARILTGILEGEEGPRRDIVILNAGAAIYLGGKAASVAAGITAAEQAIDSGKAYEKLLALVRATGGNT